MTALHQPEVIQSLIEQYGAAEVHQAWLTVHGWPATWIPSTQNAIDVAEYLETHNRNQKGQNSEFRN